MLCCFAHGDELSVAGGVTVDAAAIARNTDDFTLVDNHCPYGNFAQIGRQPRMRQCQVHKLEVIFIE